MQNTLQLAVIAKKALTMIANIYKVLIINNEYNDIKFDIRYSASNLVISIVYTSFYYSYLYYNVIVYSEY